MRTRHGREALIRMLCFQSANANGSLVQRFLLNQLDDTGAIIKSLMAGTVARDGAGPIISAK